MIPLLTFLLGSCWGIALVAYCSTATLPAWTGRVGRWADAAWSSLALRLDAVKANLSPKKESRQ